MSGRHDPVGENGATPDLHQSVDDAHDRFVLEGRDPGAGARTIIGWAQTQRWSDRAASRRLVTLTLDATPRTAVVLTDDQAIVLSDHLRRAAGYQ